MQREPTTLITRLRRAAELLSALLFAIMLGAFLIQVFTRYVLDDPASWTLEVCSIAYVWIVFFASAVIVDQRQHIDLGSQTGHGTGAVLAATRRFGRVRIG